MKAAVLLLAFFLGTASVARAGEGKFEIRAVATHPGPPATEYLSDDNENARPEKLFLEPEILLDTAALVSAEAKVESQGWAILVILSADGRKRLGEVTGRYLERRLAILIDGKVRCAPVVRAAIFDGSLEISGNFDEEEARKLAADLNAAANRPAAPAPAAPATPGNP